MPNPLVVFGDSPNSGLGIGCHLIEQVLHKAESEPKASLQRAH